MIQAGGNRLWQHGGLGVHRTEVVGNVGVDGRSPSLHFPVAGYFYLVPLGIALQGLHVMVVLKVLEVPGSVEVQVILTFTESLREGVFAGGEIDDFRAMGVGVHRGGLHVLPEGQANRKKKGCCYHNERVSLKRISSEEAPT